MISSRRSTSNHARKATSTWQEAVDPEELVGIVLVLWARDSVPTSFIFSSHVFPFLGFSTPRSASSHARRLTSTWQEAVGPEELMSVVLVPLGQGQRAYLGRVGKLQVGQVPLQQLAAQGGLVLPPLVAATCYIMCSSIWVSKDWCSAGFGLELFGGQVLPPLIAIIFILGAVSLILSFVVRSTLLNSIQTSILV